MAQKIEISSIFCCLQLNLNGRRIFIMWIFISEIEVKYKIKWLFSIYFTISIFFIYFVFCVNDSWDLEWWMRQKIDIKMDWRDFRLELNLLVFLSCLLRSHSRLFFWGLWNIEQHRKLPFPLFIQNYLSKTTFPIILHRFCEQLLFEYLESPQYHGTTWFPPKFIRPEKPFPLWILIFLTKLTQWFQLKGSLKPIYANNMKMTKHNFFSPLPSGWFLICIFRTLFQL